MQLLWDSIDLPLRTELRRHVAGQPAGAVAKPAAEILAEFRPSGGDEGLVVALKQPGGVYAVVLPRAGSPLRPIAEAIVATSEEQSGRLRKVGENVYLSFDYRYRSEVATRLGVKFDQITGGVLVPISRLAERTPVRGHWLGSELEVFQRGNAVVHYRWTDRGAEVAPGSRAAPGEVVKAGMDAGEFSFLSLLWRPDWSGAFRREDRSGKSFWAIYAGSTGPSGFNGVALAYPAETLQYDMDQFQDAAVAIGSFGLLLVLFFVLAYSTYVGGRISRPVLEVRDALKRISEGDYSVRIDSKRTDEIGQL
jgi:HAMP domain-containing protein